MASYTVTDKNGVLTVKKNEEMTTAGAAGIAILLVAGWMFSPSAEKTPMINSPHSSHYVTTTGTFKQTLIPGVQYVHFNDNSCTTSTATSKCLTTAQFEQACNEFEGINSVDTTFKEVYAENTITEEKVQLTGRTGVSFDTMLNITGFKRGFGNNRCMIKVAFSNATSVNRDKFANGYAAEVTSWMINPEGKLVATRTDNSTADYWSKQVEMK